ncbi:hypothetical protein [Paenibacillus alginolyticus]|nr:hypothetical protein [Paenibacillus frigoriresistens]
MKEQHFECHSVIKLNMKNIKGDEGMSMLKGKIALVTGQMIDASGGSHL